jgi:hypothetical protein
MTETCAKCKVLDDSISNDNLINCRQCSKATHAQCAEIDSALFDALMNNRHLSWTCDDCLDEGSKWEKDDRLDLILNKLSTVCADVELLKANAPPKPAFSSLFRNGYETPKTAKRRADEKGQSSVKRQRVATPAVVIGTGAANDVLKAVAPMKWLYVSRLDPQTSEEAVTNVLTTALQVDAKMFTCVKLVPRMQNPTFISFKVGMSEELLQKSLAPEFWPPGIAIREFVNRPRSFFGPPIVRL